MVGRPKTTQVWCHFRETADGPTCKYCEKHYRRAHLAKMKRHLLKCINCPEECKRQMRATGSEGRNIQNKENENPMEPNVTTENVQNSANLLQTPLSDGIKENLHTLLAKAVYVTGTPLSMVEHPLWINFFEKLQPLYKLPSRKTISTTILEKTYNSMHRELKEDLMTQKCLHLLLDGWSNCRNEGIINILISKPEPIFVKSIASEDHRHTGEYICNIILDILNEYGPHKFATLIGDNASNVQRAFSLVKQNHPHIVGLNCSAHTLHLLCKNIMKINVLNAFKDMATNIIKTIRQSQVLTSLLAKIVKEKKVGESLKLPCDTRWGSHCLCFQSMENTKVALQTLAVHEKATNLPPEDKSALLDEDLWTMLKQCRLILEPITEAIIRLESNDNSMHKVFLTLKNMKSKLLFCLPEVTIVENDVKEKILDNVDQRIQMCYKPIHYAAYLLDPAEQGAELDENQDAEAMEFISEVGQSIGLTVTPNLASYRSRSDFWSRRFLWENVEEIKPTTWWSGLCGSTALSKVAVRILTAPCTSAAVERSFSTHSHIHNKKRNRLTTERAAKIAYISYNWNLLNKSGNNFEKDDDYGECVCVTPPTIDTHAHRTDSSMDTSDSPQPSTSGTATTTEFLDCGHISDSSNDDD